MPEPEIKTCIAMVGEPFHMSRCNRPAVYLKAGEAGPDNVTAIYSGWRHVDPADDVSHGAVPKGWV